MNPLFICQSLTKRLNFVSTIFLMLMAFFANAQNPTVINDSLVVNNRVYAKEKLIVDQEAKFKEDIKVLGTARLMGDLIVNGTAKFHGNVKMENLGQVTLTDSSEIIVILPNGQLKKGNIAGILTETLPPLELDLCGAEGGVPKWWPGVNKLFTACQETNVGIATTNPLHKLHVVGVNYAQKFLAGNSTGSTTALVNAFTGTQDLVHLGVKIGGLPEVIRLTITSDGSLNLTNVGTAPSFTLNNGTGHAVVVNSNSGSKILQLENSGMLRAREIKVDEASWADYVFDKNYKLPKLKDVAKYIDENHHLPGVPSAAEIESDGLNLGDMQNIQMQKIEELTLYMIEMEKRIEALEKENEELKNAIK